MQLGCSAITSLTLLFALTTAAYADCAVDSTGEVYCGGGRCAAERDGTVWCARAYAGDAVRTRDGSVACGTGKCAADSRGRVYCSSIVGGAALRDSQGRVRCHERCERATQALCERTVAGSSE